VQWLGTNIMMNLLVYSRMDSQVLWCRLDDRSCCPGTPLRQVMLEKSAPRTVRVEIDGQRRPAFQCAFPWQPDGIMWVECDGAVFGLDSGRQYPFFLQSHALHKLR
jgi:hypothetical protein